MSTMGSSMDSPWWLLLDSLGSHSPFHPSLLLAVLLLTTILTWAFSPAGFAWRNGRIGLGRVPIPGPRGLPFLGSLLSLSDGLPHRALASMARASKAKSLMAFSLGSTPAVVSSDPAVSREILFHSSFADRPVKRSARELMFERAIGFAPSGAYWRLLRRTAALHLFAPHSIAAHEQSRQADCDAMLKGMTEEQKLNGSVTLRPHLQGAALNNIMGTVFGKRYDVSNGTADKELVELRYLVREGFELLGAFNWSDHLPWLSFFYDPDDVVSRCAKLVPRVRSFVKAIVDQHRSDNKEGCPKDFVHVLLSLDGNDKMKEDDIIAVLWEMVFRGTDTTALVTEWTMAELVRHPTVQAKLRSELDTVVGPITDANVSKLPYLKAVVKETLRLHPPGPLLSWARMSTSDVPLSNGMVVPAHTTAMVNMWSITHDPAIWNRPEAFLPERFLDADVDVRGGDLRLAPFGAGRRVCPGRNLGLVTVGLWIARLVRSFKWKDGGGAPVDVSEVLKLSCEMKNPLRAVVVPRE